MRRWIFVLLCILCGRLNLCYAQKVFDPERILQGRIENMEEGLGEEVFDDLLDNGVHYLRMQLRRTCN